MSFDNSNQAILKKVVSSKKNAPIYHLELTVEGKKYKASLWPWTRKDGSKVLDRNQNTQLKGDVEVDDYAERQQQEGMAQARQAAEPDLADDSLPF